MIKEITINELINKPVYFLDMDSTQVMEIAKVDYKTARKYLPISKEG